MLKSPEVTLRNCPVRVKNITRYNSTLFMKYARNTYFVKGFLHKFNVTIHEGFLVSTYEKISQVR